MFELCLPLLDCSDSTKFFLKLNWTLPFCHSVTSNIGSPNTEYPLPYITPSHFSDQFPETQNQSPSFWMPFLIALNILNNSQTSKCQLGKKYLNPKSLLVSAPHFLRDPWKIRLWGILPQFLSTSSEGLETSLQTTILMGQEEREGGKNDIYM